MAKNFKRVEPLQVDFDKALSSEAAAYRAANLLRLTYIDPQTGSVFDTDDLCGDDVWSLTQAIPREDGESVVIDGSGPLVRVLNGIEKELKDLGAGVDKKPISVAKSTSFLDRVRAANAIQPNKSTVPDATATKIKILQIKYSVVMDIIVTRYTFEVSYEAARAAKAVADTAAVTAAKAQDEARRELLKEKYLEEMRKNPSAATTPAPTTPTVALA
jgi:hypothetical protein